MRRAWPCASSLYCAVRDAAAPAAGTHELVGKHFAISEARAEALGMVDGARCVAHILDGGLSAPRPQPPVGVVLLADLVRLPAALQHGRHGRAAANGDKQLRADPGAHSADAAHRSAPFSFTSGGDPGTTA